MHTYLTIPAYTDFLLACMHTHTQTHMCISFYTYIYMVTHASTWGLNTCERLRETLAHALWSTGWGTKWWRWHTKLQPPNPPGAFPDLVIRPTRRKRKSCLVKVNRLRNARDARLRWLTFLFQDVGLQDLAQGFGDVGLQIKLKAHGLYGMVKAGQ